MQLVRKRLSPFELSEINHDITNNPTSLNVYPNVEERIRNRMKNGRSELTTRGKHANSYSKTIMHILKDRVFERTRA